MIKAIKQFREQYFLGNIECLHYFGGFIAVGKKRDIAHETADPILVKDSRVAIT